MKPRIRLIRRCGFNQEMYRCTGLNMFKLESAGFGKTIEQAYENWLMFIDFTF
jgi:hypothetical protein